jgi:hypothetical protein
MGSAKRLNLGEERKSKDIPGPNVYTPKETYTKLASASWGMGSG